MGKLDQIGMEARFDAFKLETRTKQSVGSIITGERRVLYKKGLHSHTFGKEQYKLAFLESFAHLSTCVVRQRQMEETWMQVIQLVPIKS